VGRAFWNKLLKGEVGAPARPRGVGLTHVGMKRSQNEDAIFVSDEAGLYLVADGMGGHAHGEVASALAIKTVTEHFAAQTSGSRLSAVVEAVKLANRTIHQAATEAVSAQIEGGTMLAGMGTTIVALATDQDSVVIAHVGDSRIYRLRHGRLEALTRDHSLAALAAAHDASLPPLRGGLRNIITRALGIEAEVEVEVREEPLTEGDLFLLCSDGLTNMVSDERIEAILAADPPLQTACETLVAEANQNGGKDNVSCVLVQV
jgi:protein phosphatase